MKKSKINLIKKQISIKKIIIIIFLFYLFFIQNNYLKKYILFNKSFADNNLNIKGSLDQEKIDDNTDWMNIKNNKEILEDDFFKKNFIETKKQESENKNNIKVIQKDKQNEKKNINKKSDTIFNIDEIDKKNNLSWHKWETKKVITYGKWDVIVRRVGTTKFTCHIISKPLRSALYSGIRNQPYIMIHHFGYEKFILGGSSGFVIESNPTIYISGIYYSIGLNNNFFYKEISRYNNINIINKMRTDMDEMIILYTSDISGNIAIDYYSLNGINNALNYMNNYCVL
ncbi:hypothetical protein [Lyticum sinuosum]|uniref:Uncharacterized protein n=1 Tax=Lyticum sinuosum TaxID=1332059 RepID=A0AAE4VK40_9RICK|nr:hypothetical protein [Lyticum sinuosum]MDZ5760985.1 hypothetical protein [Lyticum sinuosum]